MMRMINEKHFNSEIFELRTLGRKVFREIHRRDNPAVTQKALDDLGAIHHTNGRKT